MSRYKTKKLSDVCSIITDGTHQTPQYASEGYIFLSSKNVVGGKIDWDNIKYIPLELHEQLYKRIAPKKGDVLLAKNGTTGIAAIVDRDCIFDIYVSLALLRPANTITSKYLLYAINNPLTKRQFDSNLKGIGVPNLHLNSIRKVKIPLPSLQIQRKIADALDKAQALIDKRKQQIELLDEYIKSVFLDMFGDPVTNPMGWESRKLDDVCIKITDGVHSKPDYTEDGIKFISVKDIVKGYLDFSGCKHISPQAHNTYYKRCNPEKGDILYTKVGTYGYAALVDVDFEFSLYVSVALIKPKKGIYNELFLRESMNSFYVKRQADRSIKGIGVPDLHLIEIKKFKILTPPIELQNRFADIVQKTEQQKRKMQESLAKLEENYQSISQRAFAGELFV